MEECKLTDLHGPQPQVVMIQRHATVTRLTHWVNVVCFCVLLSSGLQIFNAWPQLYWGQSGADSERAVLQIGAATENGRADGFLRIAGHTLHTTGVLGVSYAAGEQVERAFPSWLTLPASQDLAAGRRWHFFFAWCFLVNGAAYLAYGFLSGHFRRNLKPQRSELAPSHLWREVVEHARLRFPNDGRARHYNSLQKLSYIAVVGLLLPIMLLSGLTMSPGINAAFPWLLDIFGGRQSARTLHFIAAGLLVLFVLVHLAMVALSGAWNLRSMISRRYAIRKKGTHE